MEHVRQLCLLRLTPDMYLQEKVRGEKYRIGHGPRRTGWIHEAIKSLVPPSPARMRKARVA
jgi:hypothetical protein